MFTLLIFGLVMAAGAAVGEGGKSGSSMGYYQAGAAEIAAYGKQRLRGLISPLPNVPSDKWTAFVKRMRAATWDAPGGGFGLRPPAFVATGIASKAEKTSDGWSVTWKRGFSSKTFLASRGLQYRVFSALCAHVAKRNAPLFRRVGQVTPIGVVSLSGLIALIIAVGAKGAAAWLKKPATRQARATLAFQRGNGVF